MPPREYRLAPEYRRCAVYVIRDQRRQLEGWLAEAELVAEPGSQGDSRIAPTPAKLA